MLTKYVLIFAIPPWEVSLGLAPHPPVARDDYAGPSADQPKTNLSLSRWTPLDEKRCSNKNLFSACGIINPPPATTDLPKLVTQHLALSVLMWHCCVGGFNKGTQQRGKERGGERCSLWGGELNGKKGKIKSVHQGLSPPPHTPKPPTTLKLPLHHNKQNKRGSFRQA